MNFFMAMNPPTCTAQEHKVRMVNNRPVFYDPPEVKAAKELLMSHLAANRPQTPLTGALALTAIWMFPRGKHRNGEWRVTRPDTDNLQKLLKDCMTQVGFWLDDALVAHETVEKRWSDEPCGIYVEISRLPEEPYGE